MLPCHNYIVFMLYITRQISASDYDGDRWAGPDFHGLMQRD